MRRALASLLLGTLNLPLIGGLLPADSDRSLPSCCRRAGQHHCTMMGQSEDPAGSGFQAASRCTSWPKADARLTNIETATPVGGFRSASPISSWTTYTSIHFAFCCRATDSVRKRGPPASLD
jgi:hypothetical protein